MEVVETCGHGLSAVEVRPTDAEFKPIRPRSDCVWGSLLLINGLNDVNNREDNAHMVKLFFKSCPSSMWALILQGHHFRCITYKQAL